jgi:hypothetical protein
MTKKKNIDDTSFWSVVSEGRGFRLKGKEHVVYAEQTRLRLRGQIESEDQNLLITNSFTVRIYIPSIKSKMTPYLSTPVAKDGTWEIDLVSFEHGPDLLELTKESKSFYIELRVVDGSENERAKKKLSSKSAFKNLHVLKLTSALNMLELKSVIHQIKVADLPNGTNTGSLALQLWASTEFKGKPIATAKKQKDNIFKFQLPNKLQIDPQTIEVYWLRLIDDEKKTEFGSCPILFSQKERVPNVRTIRINNNMPRLFQLAKKTEYIKSLLTPPILRNFCRKGVATLHDIQKHRQTIPEDIGRAFQDLGNILKELFPEKEPEIDNDFSLEEVMEWTDRILTESVGTIQVNNCWLAEEQWQYRFSTWSLNDSDKNKTINKYARCAELPCWREEIYSFFNEFDNFRLNVLTKHRLKDWMSAQGLKIQNVISDPNSSDAFSVSIDEALQELERLGTEVRQRLVDLENMPVSRVKVTTYTGGLEQDGTNDWVEHSTYYPIFNFESGVQTGMQPGWITMGAGDEHRNKNQIDVFDDFPGGYSLIQFGDLKPEIKKKGRDGWRLNNWTIEVEHNGISYLHLPGIEGNVWLNPDEDSRSDVEILGIGAWTNPYYQVQSTLKYLMLEMEALCDDLRNSLHGQIDNCLTEIIDGNWDYIRGNWSGAADTYRAVLGKVLNGNFNDSTSSGYKRLIYILLLHIGDCYWQNHEFERAVKLFLSEACQFRKADFDDDHFLWNHVAKCMIDWADYRYRKCGNNSSQFLDFGTTDAANPIDPDYAISLENKEGPYQLYNRVLRGGFHCISRLPRPWKKFDILKKKLPPPVDVSDCELTPFPHWRCDLSWRYWLCKTESDIILKKAQLGIEKITDDCNALGYRIDYIPPDRFKWLIEKAFEESSGAKEQADNYLTARIKLDEQIELIYELEYLKDIAEIRHEMAEIESDRAKIEYEAARTALENLENKIGKLEESRDRVIFESLVGSTLSIVAKNFKPIGKAVSGEETPKLGAVASIAVKNIPALAATIGGGPQAGLVVFLAGELIQGIPAIAENTWKANEKLTEEIKAARSKLEQAKQDRDNKRVDQFLKDKELEIRLLEKEYLEEKMDMLGQTNLYNPAFWCGVMKIRERLWKSYFARAIKYGWLAERALNYEIPNLQPEGSSTIRFDYADTNLENLSTGADVFENDLKTLDDLRYEWYRQNFGGFAFYDIRFKDHFPGELIRIQMARSRQVISSFRTTVKMFDKSNRSFNVFQRIKSLTCFYEVGENVGRIFNADLKNSPMSEGDTVASFWRSPIETEKNHEFLDWIELEGFDLVLKPALTRLINVYPLFEEQAVQNLDNLTNEDIDQLTCFENCGVEMDWTLRMSKPDTAFWDRLDDIHLKFIYWAKQDSDVADAIWEAERSETVHHTLIKSLNESVGYPFKMVFHPDNKYTDELTEHNNGIPFRLEESESEIHPCDAIRRLEGLSVLLFFDADIVNENDIPELKFRLRKNINGSMGENFEVNLTSPGPTDIHHDGLSCVISEQLLESDPVGSWEIEMRSDENLNYIGEPNRFSGLLDIFVVFDYSCTPSN